MVRLTAATARSRRRGAGVVSPLRATPRASLPRTYCTASSYINTLITNYCFVKKECFCLFLFITLKLQLFSENQTISMDYDRRYVYVYVFICAANKMKLVLKVRS